jgi:hypothetical protein
MWEELLATQLEPQNSSEPAKQPNPVTEWQVLKPEFETLNKFCTDSLFLQGYIHTNNTRCTILSPSNMQWVTYFLTAKDRGKLTLREIPDS